MKDDNTPLGVILTGGKATRLRPLSNFYPKSQIPLLNKPLIEYSMDLLAEAGIQDIAIVVGPDDKTTGPIAKKYRSDVNENDNKNVNVSAHQYSNEHASITCQCKCQ